MSIEFQVSQDALAVVKNTVIEANFAECEAALTEMMEPYKTMVVTEDGIAAAKNDRASIRKVAGRIDEMRKTVKKAYSEPLKAFEDKCKALIGICDEGSANLDGQIKAFEERERAEKIDILHQFYLENTDEDERAFCPWEWVAKKEWGNKTYSIDAAEEEILDAVCKMRSDLNVVREYGEGDTPYLLDIYKQTHELSAVVRKASELKTMREREAARKLEAEEAAARAKERFEQTTTTAHTPVVESHDDPQDEPLVTVSFKVTCTKAQLTALGDYMKRNGIKYGRA
jgi:PHD/YefM family antitoxin component YafN of YafNO toxin-antitoxin module